MDVGLFGTLDVPEQAALTAGANEQNCDKKHNAADGARLALKEEAGEVEHHQHNVIVEERRVHRFGDEQHRDQPLQAVHDTQTTRRVTEGEAAEFSGLSFCDSEHCASTK